jgi:hypothetical protein
MASALLVIAGLPPQADDVGASLKVGHGQVERSAQRANGDRT